MSDEILTTTWMRLCRRLKASARRLLGDEEDAADAVQDAFMKLWSQRGKLNSEEAVRGTAVVAVRNVCIDTIRRRTVRPTESLDAPDTKAIADTDSAEARSEMAETYAGVTALIDSRLSKRDRQVLLLRDRDGLEFEEIAQRMGLTVANVRVILSRSRRTIRDIYLNKKQ